MIQGVQNFYDCMECMNNFGLKFIDIIWGVGGWIVELMCEMVVQVQIYLGFEICMYFICIDMGEEKVNDVL